MCVLMHTTDIRMLVPMVDTANWPLSRVLSVYTYMALYSTACACSVLEYITKCVLMAYRAYSGSFFTLVKIFSLKNKKRGEFGNEEIGTVRILFGEV